jgi:hypothetical protein
MGCTDCGKKGGCDTRKHGMFAAVDEAMERLYPTHRWGERNEAAAFDAGISADEGQALAVLIAQRLKTLAMFRAGDPDEWCDYIYVLCLGRTPSIAEIRDGQDGAHATVFDAGGETGADAGIDERYLRVALSSVVRFAGVQEVAMTLNRVGDDIVITESARGGVFDPVLLKRFQALVAVLAETDIRHLDFGEIVEAPAGFDPADYPDRFGAPPVIANYLFYPQPPTSVSTTVVSRDATSSL